VTTAPPEDQLRLLDVQALDTRTAQLAHQRRTHPVLARLTELDSRLADLETSLVASRTAARDLRRELAKSEADVEQVRSRADRDRARMDSGKGSAKDLQALSSELVALARRQGELEEVELEVMERLEAHEAALAELEAVRAHREELQRRIDELEQAAARDRQAIAELSAALGDRPPDAAEAAEAAAEEEPKSVLEAVRLAAGTAQHLTFTESAFESAADSPYRRPAEILDALRKLDQLGERFAAGQMGVSLGQAAQELGLTWRAGVSELARTRWAKHYVVTHDGHQLDLGPHLALGSGSGAGFVARIYLHVADGGGDVPRGIYVGHVGRHLPDTTT
jgi:uncharacterized protein